MTSEMLFRIPGEYLMRDRWQEIPQIWLNITYRIFLEKYTTGIWYSSNIYWGTGNDPDGSSHTDDKDQWYDEDQWYDDEADWHGDEGHWGGGYWRINVSQGDNVLSSFWSPDLHFGTSWWVIFLGYCDQNVLPNNFTLIL